MSRIGMTGSRGGGVTFRWYGREAARKLEEGVWRGLQRASEYARTLIVREISKSGRVGGGGRRHPGYGLTKGGRKRKAGAPMHFSRSRPGQPPKSDTGRLRRSIFRDGDRRRLRAVVGTTLKYGVYLERGAHIPPRRPRFKKVLVFAANGQWVYTRFASGFRLRRRPYLVRTVAKHRRKLSRVIQREIQRMTK